MRLQFGFVIFWRKDFGAKAAHKILVKLIPDVAVLLHRRLPITYRPGASVIKNFTAVTFVIS